LNASLNVNGLLYPTARADRGDRVVGADEQVGGEREAPGAEVGDR
jgi:hypothetical protein